MGIKYSFDHPLDTADRSLAHRKLILSKPFLKKIYCEWYDVFARKFGGFPENETLEVGSGGGFLKETMPGVITSDILPITAIDRCFSALDMPFGHSSLMGICMLNTFHHLPDAHTFLSEANRVLRKNGRLVMIEPATTHWSKFVYSLFHHEPFLPDGDWTVPDKGPMSSSNSCLPWIVFIRDKALFKQRFPELEIEAVDFHTSIKYLLSGGVSIKQLVPGFSYRFFTAIDKILCKMSTQFAMFMTISIRKK